MPAITPKLAEFLVKTTMARDIRNALDIVLAEYLELKLKELNGKSVRFENKWQMNFTEFQEKIRNDTLGKDSYSYETEQDFWEWEETETLKNHYSELLREWN